jgi:hypothetical protein
MNVALVTYSDEGKYTGEGTNEDTRLLAYLKAKGLQVAYNVWNNAAVNWGSYEAVILKSPWDYFDKVAEFKNWLQQLQKEQIKVLNPIDVVNWNLDKKYLLDIEQAGFAIVPTRIVPQNSFFAAEPFFELWQTNTILIKPAISGGAKNTFPIPVAEVARLNQQVNKLLKTETFLVQPFMPEIQTQGEWSLLFFNGNFSHAVRKVPQRGDFRVQHFFGGEVLLEAPAPSIIKYGQELVQKFASGCLYARVDGLESNGEFKLMELELIEPLLFLQQNEALYENYYQALKSLLYL